MPKCIHCGSDISNLKSICPNCQKLGNPKSVPYILMLIGFIIMFINSSSNILFKFKIPFLIESFLWILVIVFLLPGTIEFLSISKTKK